MKISGKISLLLTAWFGVCAHSGSAQLTVNGDLVTLPETVITIQTPFNNNGSVTNQGTFNIHYDWTNNGAYQDSLAGVISLKGETTQVIHFTSDAELYSLDVNGPGYKELQGNVSVINLLSLTEGIVKTDSNYRFIIQENATIEGGNEFAHIEGALFHAGTGDKFYPIGKNGNYRPVWLSDIQGSSPVIGFEMFEPNPSDNPIEGLGADWVPTLRYWKKTLLSGSYSKAFITLSLGENEEGFESLEEVEVGEALNPEGAYRSIGHNIISGSLFNSTVKSYDPAVGNYFVLLKPKDESSDKAIFVPSALCPTAPDPEDRVVKVYSRSISSDGFYFRVFNKKGIVVFESYSYSEMATSGWDGRVMSTGSQEPTGTFSYIMGGSFKNGDNFKHTGFITQVR